jgi:hypothetical protein
LFEDRKLSLRDNGLYAIAFIFMERRIHCHKPEYESKFSTTEEN